jgi:phosphoglycerate dehydrogenase-like enzyme
LPVDARSALRRLLKVKEGTIRRCESRGPVVDEAALAGLLSSAALDVFETEPLDPRSLPTELKDVILAPHLGSYSVERVALPRQRWGELVLQAASGGLPSRRSSSTRISSTVVALPECARVTQY